jgi:hypothetical protein
MDETNKVVAKAASDMTEPGLRVIGNRSTFSIDFVLNLGVVFLTDNRTMSGSAS